MFIFQLWCAAVAAPHQLKIENSELKIPPGFR